MTKAKNGDKVKVHYTGKLDNGEQFDSSVGSEPLEFTIGEGSVLEKFENAVIDLSPGDSVDIHIPAIEAYGLKREDLILKVPSANLPPDIKPELGMKLQMKTEQGQIITLTIVEILEDGVMIDANHELAGQDLNFNIQLVEIVP